MPTSCSGTIFSFSSRRFLRVASAITGGACPAVRSVLFFSPRHCTRSGSAKESQPWAATKITTRSYNKIHNPWQQQKTQLRAATNITTQRSNTDCVLFFKSTLSARRARTHRGRMPACRECVLFFKSTLSAFRTKTGGACPPVGSESPHRGEKENTTMHMRNSRCHAGLCE